jgi:hypothetical protein
MRRRSGNFLPVLVVCAAAAALSACSHADAVTGPVAAQPAAASAEPAAAAFPVTREQASTDCWMKYDKEARHLSLDQKLPLVEKCTAEKLKAAAR